MLLALALVHRARDSATGEKLNLLLDGRQSRFLDDGGSADYQHQIDQRTRNEGLALASVLAPEP